MSGKIALFGATGMCGSALMRKALAEGYQVNAMVRSSSKITEENDKLTVIEGDLENTDVIQKTTENVDYVVVMLGGLIGDPKNYPAGFITQGVEAIVEQMKKQSSIKSLTVLTGAFSMEPGEERSFFSRQLTSAIIRVVGMKPNIDDHQGVNAFIGSIQNDVSFGTIVMRPARLGNGEFKSAVKALEKSPSMMYEVTNEELAVYALEVMKDESMYGKFPFIGHK